MYPVKNEADVDKELSHIPPVVAQDTLILAGYVTSF